MFYESFIYKNLVSEMIKKNITLKKLKEIWNLKTDKSVRERLQGKMNISISEAKVLRDTFFPDMTIDDLFKKEI